jgi:Flp pilus assembly protein TadD
MLKLKGVRIHGWGIAIGTTLVLAAAVPLAVVACGGADQPEASAERSVRETVHEAQLPPPLPKIETTLAAAEPPEVAAPEPPKEVTYEDAESAFLERRYDEAVELFVLYSERRPENPWGYYMLGLSASKANEHERAEEAFERALELEPMHVKSWLNLGRVLLAASRSEEALLKIEEGLVLDPESNSGLRLQGRAFHQLGRPEDAIDSYRQAILIDDEDAWSMNNMGLILIGESRFEEALPPLARAVELRDDIAIFQNNLGIALERTGNVRTAEESYKSALALDGTHEKARVNLMRVELLEEDLDLMPVALAELAQAFIDEIEGWREAVAHNVEIWPDWAELEPVMETITVTEPDTVSSEALNRGGS